MPKFWLSLLVRSIEGHIFLHLDYKSYLSAVTKVRNGQATNFLDEGLSGELEFVLALFDQVLKFVGLELHDTADRKFRSPFTLVQISQNIFHVHRFSAIRVSWLSRKFELHHVIMRVLVISFNSKDWAFASFFIVGLLARHAITVGLSARRISSFLLGNHTLL